MSRVLVTGGTGTLGRALVPLLLADGHAVRVLTRGSSLPRGAEGARGDLATGAGIRGALQGIGTIVHCATSPQRRTRAVDVGGMRELLRHAERGSHLIYPSIVGVDRNPLRYYRAKLAAERVLARGGSPWTILRVTQFHELLAFLLGKAARSPVTPVPRGFRFQPIAAGEAAQALAAIARGEPLGRAPDLGGPQVRTIEDLAATFLTARGRPARLARIPVPGHVGRAFRLGAQTVPERALGTITWEEFLEA